jgi:hypothetical protein
MKLAKIIFQEKTKDLHAEFGGERSGRQNDRGMRIGSSDHNGSVKIVSNVLPAEESMTHPLAVSDADE